MKAVSPHSSRVRRILLRSGKSPYDVFPVEEALQHDVIASNAGNLIFSDATHKILETPHATVVSNGIRADGTPAGRINEEYDAFVVPLANAFRPSFEPGLRRLTRLIGQLKIPVVVVGVGAQAGLDYDPARLKPMEPTVREFVSAVLDRSASIGVRGEFTEKYLNDLGFKDVDVIGCPSLFMGGGELAVRKRTQELTTASRIAVNGSHDAVRDQGMGRVVTRAHARYPNLRFIGQNLSDATQLHWRDLSGPNGKVTAMPTHPDHPMYREGKVRVYIDPVTWIDDLRDFDFSFGSRIHGNIAALLAGTPANVLCSDSRTLELCRYFEIPHHPLDRLPEDIDPARLYAETDLGPLTGNHPERFERFVSFLDRNGLDNTFTHGDGGAAHERRLRSLDFPGGVRPWTDTDPASLFARFGWLHNRVGELSADNARLKKELVTVKARIKAAARTDTPKTTVVAPSSGSVYRKARRFVGRPLRRALQSARG